MYNKTKKAFTLVELIVVITIIAILGTIAFISLQGYSEHARDSKRLSDIQNIKKSLELFSINTGVYPLPDNPGTVTYSGDLLRTQGIIGDTVTKNLSKNLQSKPLDPQFDIEYSYSVTNSQTEYELMSLYESDFVNNKNILNSLYASDKYKIKIDGIYNQVFVKSKNYIIPTPSIINAELDGITMVLDDNNINSQIITGGYNLLNLNISGLNTLTGNLAINLRPAGLITKDSTLEQKKSVITSIQNAYSGTILENIDLYKKIIEVTEDEKEELVDILILKKIYTSNSSISNDDTLIVDEGPKLYDDFSGDLSKWDIFKTSTVYSPLIENGQLKIQCDYNKYIRMLSNQPLINNGNYIKVTNTWYNNMSSGNVFIIKAIDFNNLYFYIPHEGMGYYHRIYKIKNGVASLLIGNTLNKTSPGVEYIYEFYQNENGDLIAKRNGEIMITFNDTEIDGNKIGIQFSNNGYSFNDDVYYK